jgi:hypothetical protein
MLGPRAWIPGVVFSIMLAPVAAGQTMAEMDNDSFRVSTPTHEQYAGPQEAVTFPLLIKVHRPFALRFEFSLPQDPDGEADGFHVVIPEPVVIEPTKSLFVNLQVYTPFHNGYVDDEEGFMVRVQSLRAEEPHEPLEFTEFALLVHANGWYVPAPGLLPLLVAFAAAAMLVGHRRRW